MKTNHTKIVHHLKLFVFGSILTLFATSSAFSQTTISGIVTDENNETIPGVGVLIEGTNVGAYTEEDGSYSIKTDLTGKRTLRFSFLEFTTETREVDLNGSSIKLNVTMKSDVMELNSVVVTGVTNPKSKLESSISLTTLDPEMIEKSAPRTTAEVLRTIPGLKAEASAGDGNTNITVRGVPISAGGSRYLQIQEDGLPLLMYGDIAFGTQDQFLRLDQTVGRVEALRGGSASILTSNGPAGIVNFISKTGAQEGGMIGTSMGVDYRSFRTDFNYGAPINKTLSYNIGGFYRLGEGGRAANHNVNNGGQIKANLTKRFDKGYVRLYGKFLNDRTAAYMPMPIAVSGTNENPTWESVNGFSAVNNGLQSPFFQQSYGYGPDGNLRKSDIADGIHTKSNSIGASMSFDLGNGWKLTNNSRYTNNSGRFVAPFTAQVDSTNNLMNEILIANGDTTAAGGALPYSINQVASGDTIDNTANGIAQRIHLFDVELENFSNFMSDTRLAKDFGDLEVSAGVFKGNQNVEMSWLWNSFISEVGENAELLNINAAGNDLTTNGQIGYGVPYWGNCCTGKYDLNFDITAPYANVGYETGDLSIEAGARYDFVNVNGTVSPSMQLANIDVNGNGTIDAPEQSVSVVDNSNAKVVDYNYGYLSYSAGVNYKLDATSAIYARYSQGYVGNAERATWHQGGPYLENQTPKNSLAQAELGYKKMFKKIGLSATAFYANTQEEAGVEATTQKVLSNDYRSLGVEFEASAKFGGFDMRGSATFVDAQIVGNNDTINIGNTPRRQPALSYSFIPSYTFEGGHRISLSVLGQTKAYAQDDNRLVMPGYAILNAVVSLNIKKDIRFVLSANNLLNTIGITESEEGSIMEGQTNFIRARSITGRTISAGINFRF
ncbi:MAG: TonB-dependent receptor [Crocinitomicaceae bacterium]